MTWIGEKIMVAFYLSGMIGLDKWPLGSGPLIVCAAYYLITVRAGGKFCRWEECRAQSFESSFLITTMIIGRRK